MLIIHLCFKELKFTQFISTFFLNTRSEKSADSVRFNVNNPCQIYGVFQIQIHSSNQKRLNFYPPKTEFQSHEIITYTK